MYISGELNSTVQTCTLTDGLLEPVTSCPATFAKPSGVNQPSHIECSPGGRFVYVANRGADYITVLAVAHDGLQPIADVPTGGRYPRHFAQIGDFLYVAKQESGTVTALQVDTATGVPAAAHDRVNVPQASCIPPPAASASTDAEPSPIADLVTDSK